MRLRVRTGSCGNCCVWKKRRTHACFSSSLQTYAKTIAVVRASARALSRSYDAPIAAPRPSMEKLDKTPLTVFDLAIQVAVAAATDIPVLAEESADAVRDNANLLREVTALAAQILSDVNLPPVSEEDAVRLLDDGARETGGVENEEHFILDPIDGTAGLLGGRECAVGLALARNGDLVWGAMGLPMTREDGVLVYGARGEGARYEHLHDENVGGELRARSDEHTAGGTVAAASDAEAPLWYPTNDDDDGGGGGEAPPRIRRICCGSLVRYAAVALGDADFTVLHGEKDPRREVLTWDHAAGIAVAEAAGAIVTDYRGTRVAPMAARGRRFAPHGGIVVATPETHERAVRMASRAPLADGDVRGIALLDRDGTLNVDVGSPGVLTADRLVAIPGARSALVMLEQAQFSTALVTNQSCVGKGLASLSDIRAVNDELARQLAPASFGPVLMATETETVDTRTGLPTRRKPSPRMLHEALVALRAGRRAMQLAFYVGDTMTDMSAAAQAGVMRVLVGTGYGKDVVAIARSSSIPIPCWLVRGDMATNANRLMSTLPNHEVSDDELTLLGIPEEAFPLVLAMDIGQASDTMRLFADALDVRLSTADVVVVTKV